MSDTRARRPGPTVRTRVVEVNGDTVTEHEDRLATEEPLEIRLAWPGAVAERLAVTMRTPGHDFELAAGWLVHEQIVPASAIESVRYCTDADLAEEEEFNVVTVHSSVAPAYLPAARTVSSACGVCGTGSIDDALRAAAPVASTVVVPFDVVRALPEALRAAQPGFDRTGGLHAAGLFETDGTAVVVREDVGRHNAVDKAVGSRLLGGQDVPPVLVLSGRVGFELVQKAVVSGISAVVAVGAPSSLAVSLAERAGVGLAGFTRSDRCVAYAGAARFGV
ncbi:formate dehydrogenase accessory sulfurtransferase FdhD [Nocardioides marmorisolisilvae]|uniref:Sulfur carrier protein FdhD n=1 Tax=Nocardioides marmorisolisilvae TaxID=1542737 RepID=A0A3N0DUL1_9ACTN|nr:formate dehydrogenase accessory sulfurtransferase FdhD [Nocardioides marmorisolisilvae]RNL79312.1 sulfurtransferase FdhD [Nocardioides marmorisolisilvae]